MRTYADHRRHQHVIDRLRPERTEAPTAPRLVVAPTPVAQLAPLPPLPSAPAASFDAPRVDHRRRVALGAARRDLGWQRGQTVRVTVEAPGVLRVARDDGEELEGSCEDHAPCEAHRVGLDGQGRVRLTPALLAAVGVEAGQQMLVRACAVTDSVRLVSPSLVERAIAGAAELADEPANRGVAA